LIIDDDPAIGTFIGKVAKSCDYETAATTKADVFKDRVGSWLPTHITLDLQMPGVDGIELLRFLAAEKSDAKILLISGTDPKVLDSANRIGMESGLTMSGTLTKPMRADSLRGLLKNLCSKLDVIDETSLRHAIETGQLFLAYQPKVRVSDLKIVGYEGLVRWQHPRRGLILPADFIPLAETSGVIDELTEAVIELGLRQVAHWGNAFDGKLAINLSGRNLHDLSFVDRLAFRCEKMGVGAERLILELTETSAMMEGVHAMDILTRLRLKGFELAIDDFGTGYSSLLQLARLPFSELKIDKSFVSEACRSTEALAIVKSTIDLAHSLRLRATAEGVENAAAMQLLIQLGCDVAQGYYIAKPMMASEIDNWGADWDKRRNSVPSAVLTMPVSPAATFLPGRAYDGSEEMRAAFAQTLAGLINPLWELGRNSLIGWRPAEGGIEVLMAPYQNIVDCFDESQRLLHGRRHMGDATFRAAQEITGVGPIYVPLHFKIADNEPHAVPTEVAEQVLRRYGITETQHRAVALFDIVEFSKSAPRNQVAQLNSLECSISTAQGILQELGKSIDLARTTTGDGFYIWNRDKGAQADLGTYLLTMLVIADNAISRQAGRLDMIPELRTCFAVGPHYSYHQVDGLDPRGHDYIVGDVTIALARMISKCLPGQILIGDFDRPTESDADPANPLDFVVHAQGAFDRGQLHGRTVKGARCYLTGEQADDGGFEPTRYSIRDKHGLDRWVYNQKLNIYLATLPPTTAKDDFLYLGIRKSELSAFDALEAPRS
jgi:EAL domain-containing protein (putative c-di-GMP-specific phosphodiesterase class I)